MCISACYGSVELACKTSYFASDFLNALMIDQQASRLNPREQKPKAVMLLTDPNMEVYFRDNIELNQRLMSKVSQEPCKPVMLSGSGCSGSKAASDLAWSISHGKDLGVVIVNCSPTAVNDPNCLLTKVVSEAELEDAAWQSSRPALQKRSKTCKQ